MLSVTACIGALTKAWQRINQIPHSVAPAASRSTLSRSLLQVVWMITCQMALLTSMSQRRLMAIKASVLLQMRCGLTFGSLSVLFRRQVGMISVEKAEPRIRNRMFLIELAGLSLNPTKPPARTLAYSFHLTKRTERCRSSR